jgi:hypothetical protein
MGLRRIFLWLPRGGLEVDAAIERDDMMINDLNVLLLTT